jgi:protocatechuate 3,4-dioxygenase beta subunit
MPSHDHQLIHVGRRRFLQFLGAGTTLAFPGWALGKNSLWMPEELPVTPTQTEGPFYPETSIEKQLFSDTDLIQKLGGHEFAKGQQTTITGTVRDRSGRPLNGAVVEIWQACATGRYNHSRDNKNPSLLDNNFQFWGRAITAEDGKYSFKTIIPGKYPGRTGRHIHYRIDAGGFKRLSTQCYFSDFGEDNMRDGIYNRLTPKERKLVTVEFDKPKSDDGKSKPWSGKFDVVLAKS